MFSFSLKVPTPKGKTNPLSVWWNSLTPEAKLEFKAKRRAANAINLSRKKIELEKEKREVGEKALRLCAQELECIKVKDDPEWRPSAELVQAVWNAVDAGIQTTQIAEKLQKLGFSSRAWFKIQKYVFQDTVTQTEDIGVRLLTAVRFANRALKLEYEYMKRRQRRYPQMYSSEIIDCVKAMAGIETQLAKDLVALGLISSKKTGGGGIHLHLNTPRPESLTVETTSEKENKISDTVSIGSDVTDVEIPRDPQEPTDGSDGQLHTERVAGEIPQIPRPT